MSRTIVPIDRTIYDGRRLLGHVVTEGDGFVAFDADDNAVARFNTEPAAVQAVLDLREFGDNPDAIAAYCDANEAGTPDNATIRWLLDQGVMIEAMTALQSILTGHVIYQPTGTYAPNAFGEFACILPAFDGEGLVDLVAWSARSGRIASRLGLAALLGEGQAERAAANLAGAPLPV